MDNGSGRNRREQGAVAQGRVRPNILQFEVNAPLGREIAPEERAELLCKVQALIAGRARRPSYFPAELFAEPAWDILLELYAAELTQQRVPTSQVTVQAGIPATTVLRWLKALDAAGHIVRKPDPLDARRVFLSLTPEASYAMSSYFADGTT